MDKLQRNLTNAGVSDFVNIQQSFSWEVNCDRPIGFLFIDALHDYPSVTRDFFHFERWLASGAYIAFHDYADYYPGVKTFVNELLGGKYEKVHCVGTMIVLRRVEDCEQPQIQRKQPPAYAEPHPSAITETLASTEPEADVVPNGALVSCIMPTANRPGLVPQAIQYFLRQDYPNRELIILDDGVAPVADLIPQDSRIRYVRMSNKRTMGSKHNMACEMARGEIIVHWDDDDWMADRRLSYQVSELLRQPPMTLCGLARLIYYEPTVDRAWEYVYPQNARPWVCGNSFCYQKLFWEKHPFPSQNEGADTVWVWGLRNQKVLALPDHTFYVALIHGKNTSPKRTSGACWRRYPTKAVHDLMGDDFTFYRSASRLS